MSLPRLPLFRPLAAVLLAACSLSVVAQAPGSATSLTPYEQALAAKTTVKKLPNGLTLVISERHTAPVFSFFTLVDAGSANDPQGQSGLAHMFEHIAFKGTTEIGTTDWRAEKVALANIEQTYDALEAERRKREGADPTRLATLQKLFDNAVADAQHYVVPNQFSEIAESNGAVGLNAETSEDQTNYFWSMPSNRLELWAYLESSRLGWPVPREFYKERDVVEEERRMRVDSSPQGRLVEEFLAAAYKAHPYGRPGVGWTSELSHISAAEADAFHRKFYVPSNIVIALVGDIDTKTAMPMLEKYFGRIPAGPEPETMTTVEPPQNAERSVVLREASMPIYIEGYHRPDYRSPDDAVYDAITDIFSNGRTSRLYRSLVRDQKLAQVAEGFSGFPGQKYPGLFAFYAVPLNGHTAEEMAPAIHKELERLKNEDVSDAELARFKASARASLLHSLDDNAGLAGQLADYETRFGDWHEMFSELAKVDAVTKADIRRVAQKTFVPSNRTVGRIETQMPPLAAAAEGSAPQAQAAQGGAR